MPSTEPLTRSGLNPAGNGWTSQRTVWLLFGPPAFMVAVRWLLQLMDDERPKVVEAVHWAAKNGDRSENGDYIYGKKRLREIDGRIRFLTKRLEIAVPTDPGVHHGSDQVFFGATVRYADEAGDERTVTILGIDEADSTQAQVSWISPVARALLKAREGDVVKLVTPAGVSEVEIVSVRYPKPRAEAEHDSPP